MMDGKKSVTVEQIGSPIGRKPDQRETLKGLGLDKLHHAERSVANLEAVPSFWKSRLAKTVSEPFIVG